MEAWRKRRLDRLSAPDGWLALTGFFWLDEGSNSVGGSEEHRVRLPGHGDSAGAGRVDVHGRDATFHAAPEHGWTVDGRDVEVPTRLVSDAEGPPTRVRRGDFEFHLIVRDGRLAARVLDRAAETRPRLGEIPCFPIDPAWRIEARFEPHAPPLRRSVAGVQGNVEQEIFPGAVVFEAAGASHRLECIDERGETDYWIVFGDATNGKETYGGGRFVYVPRPESGRTVLDFNKAYNPPCVFTPHSTCPRPVPENRLPIGVEAGEKSPRAERS